MRRAANGASERERNELASERAPAAQVPCAAASERIDMQQVREIVARAVPLDRSDVDTDQIIPSDWLKRIDRTGFGAGLFEEWRESSDFVLNQEQYDGAQILVAGANFGAGSSREHAVWALEDYGFRALISPRFADIFRNNCLKIGLLPVELPPAVVDRIMSAVQEDPATEIVIDVVDRRVAVPSIDLDEPFDLSDFHRYRLLEGLDDIGLTLRYEDEITAYEATRPSWALRITGSASTGNR
jgi:3-isopropylmalate/(R)-2-methylmalate dehydratase small subunit